MPSDVLYDYFGPLQCRIHHDSVALSRRERIDLATLTFHIWGSSVVQLPSEPAQRPLMATLLYLEPHTAETSLVDLCHGTSPWMTKQRQGAEVTLLCGQVCATPVHTMPGVSHCRLFL